jgi:hypothetical protein
VRVEGLGEVEVVGEGFAEGVAIGVGVGGRLAGDGYVGSSVVSMLVDRDGYGGEGFVWRGCTHALKNRPLPMRSVIVTSAWVSTSRRRWDRL